MNLGYIKVKVPRSSANDDTVMLIKWLKANGEHVRKNEDICTIESSKATFELVAETSGFLYHTRNQGEEVAVGQMIAVIAQQQQRPEILNEQSKHVGDIKVTAKASKLIEEHNLSIADFAGIDIVKEKDVRQYLEKHRVSEQESILSGRLVPLSHVERRAAKILSESAMQIPHSYLTLHINAQEADQFLAKIADKEDILVSLSDQLVACVAHTVEKHKKINASWRESGIYYHDRINVGFALNQSDGSLVVPVIRDANKMDLNAISGRIRNFQKKSIRNKFTVEDLTGGTVTVTSLIGLGVHQVFPVIFPPQAAIIAIGDKWQQQSQAFYCLTMAFDHRVLNGAEAGSFLNDIAKRMTEGESP